jgi:hypothetical protein
VSAQTGSSAWLAGGEHPQDIRRHETTLVQSVSKRPTGGLEPTSARMTMPSIVQARRPTSDGSVVTAAAENTGRLETDLRQILFAAPQLPGPANADEPAFEDAARWALGTWY